MKNHDNDFPLNATANKQAGSMPECEKLLLRSARFDIFLLETEKLWKDLVGMEEVKDTKRATVRIAYDGRVLKTFRGHQARERFENEILVLRYLERRGCSFVPKVLETDAEQLLLITSNCGKRVEHLSEAKMGQLFAELETFGVRHEDREQRNVTYQARDGRFCLIDFEFATILDDPTHHSPVAMPPEAKP